MFNLEQWRIALEASFERFARLKANHPALDVKYGILAAAILYPLRVVQSGDALRGALTVMCNQDDIEPVLDVVQMWQQLNFTPAQAAKHLSQQACASENLRAALDKIVAFFLEEAIVHSFLRPAESQIQTGDVQGANIVIGGQQYIAGNLIIRYVTVEEKIRACPTAPQPPAHFSGREDAIKQLKQKLLQGTAVAITGIQGMGGIGKTALAAYLANHMPEFSAVLWASLGPEPVTVSYLTRWAQHADPDFKPGDDDLNTIISRVRSLLTNLIAEKCPGRVLVVLDDIWEGDAVRTARLLRKAAPSNSVSLITTRSQRVVAQLRSTRFELEPMSQQGALQMLRKLLADYSAIPDAKLIRLGELVDFHPLAMELAAGQVTLLERPVSDIDDLLSDLGGGLPDGSPFREIGLELGDEREDNLELVLSFSYQRLSEAEQAAFRYTGVLAYGAEFDRQLCEAIWQQPPKPTLDALRHRALLTIAEEQGWYYQHSLLRAYARGLLKHVGEYADAFRLYGNFIIEIIDDFEFLPSQKWDTLLEYTPHIHTVGDELMVRQDDHNLIEDALVFAVKIRNYLRERPEIDREQWLKIGIKASQILNKPQLEHLLLNELVLYYTDKGQYPEAIAVYQKAMPIVEAMNDPANRAAALNNIGLLLEARGNTRHALSVMHKAVGINIRTEPRSGETAQTLHNLGSIYETLGDYRNALKLYRQALKIPVYTADLSNKANLANSIASVFSHLGDTDRAIAYYQRALNAYVKLNHKAGQASALNNLGLLYSLTGSYAQALSHYEKSLPLLRDTGQRTNEAATLSNIGIAHGELGEFESALRYYRQARQIYDAIGDKGGIANILNNIGHALFLLGDNRAAIDYYEQSITLSRQTGNRSELANTYNNLGNFYSSLGESDVARSHYQKALKIYEEQEEVSELADTHTNIGLLHLYADESDSALRHFKKACKLYRKAKNKRGLADTLVNLAGVKSITGETEIMINLCEKAIEIYRRIGARHSAATALNNIGGGYDELGFFSKALTHYQQALAIQQEIKYREGEALSYYNIAMTYQNMGEQDEAIKHLEKCVSIEREIDHPDYEPDQALLDDWKE